MPGSWCPDHRNSTCAAKQRVVKSPWSAPADAYPWPMPAAGCATSEECGGKRWEWCQVRWVGAEGQAAILTPGFRVPGAAVRSLLRVVKEDSEVLGHRALALQGLLLSHGGKERIIRTTTVTTVKNDRLVYLVRIPSHIILYSTAHTPTLRGWEEGGGGGCGGGGGGPRLCD